MDLLRSSEAECCTSTRAAMIRVGKEDFYKVKDIGSNAQRDTFKTHQRSKSTQSDSRTAYRSKVKVKVNSDSEK